MTVTVLKREQTAVMPLSGPEYAKKENTSRIAACMQQILDTEASI